MFRLNLNLASLDCGGRAGGAADIVLSSSGWVMVTTGEGEVCRFLAYTPAGKGIWLREVATTMFPPCVTNTDSAFFPGVCMVTFVELIGTVKYKRDNLTRFYSSGNSFMDT
jgi:hypothetical protein